jgi:hypothetical protein
MVLLHAMVRTFSLAIDSSSPFERHSNGTTVALVSLTL